MPSRRRWPSWLISAMSAEPSPFASILPKRSSASAVEALTNSSFEILPSLLASAFLMNSAMRPPAPPSPPGDPPGRPPGAPCCAMLTPEQRQRKLIPNSILCFGFIGLVWDLRGVKQKVLKMVAWLKKKICHTKIARASFNSRVPSSTRGSIALRCESTGWRSFHSAHEAGCRAVQDLAEACPHRAPP